jgi:hypothetical protein
MKTKDYTTSFTVDQSPEEVFDAINNVRGWWSEEVEGDTDRLGGEFRFHHKDLHRSTQKITEFVPGKKVVWHVVDGQINFVKDKTEWDGTDIVFDIARKGDKTELALRTSVWCRRSSVTAAVPATGASMSARACGA